MIQSHKECKKTFLTKHQIQRKEPEWMGHYKSNQNYNYVGNYIKKNIVLNLSNLKIASDQIQTINDNTT